MPKTIMIVGFGPGTGYGSAPRTRSPFEPRFGSCVLRSNLSLCFSGIRTEAQMWATCSPTTRLRYTVCSTHRYSGWLQPYAKRFPT
jgi:hypothetical protein